MGTHRIISADSHVSVPGELVDQFLPEKYRGATPNLMGSSLSSRQKVNIAPDMLQGPLARLAEAMQAAARDGRPLGRVGGFDAQERLTDMNKDQVDAEVLYGHLGGFYATPDLKQRKAQVQAYNNGLWEWCGADHNRLIPVGEITIDPIDMAVDELNRIAKLGYRAAMIPTFPMHIGLPPYWDQSYDPLWAAAQDLEIPLSLHVGENTWTASIRNIDPTPRMKMYTSIPPLGMVETLAGFLLTDIGERFPKLKFIMVESGIGWVAYYLERLDTMHHRHGWFQISDELPSARWYRQGAATFEEDKLGVMARDRLGVENILWATDYPHPDSTWPDSQAVIEDHFKGVSDEDRRKIIYENAVRLYKLGG